MSEAPNTIEIWNQADWRFLPSSIGLDTILAAYNERDSYPHSHADQPRSRIPFSFSKDFATELSEKVKTVCQQYSDEDNQGNQIANFGYGLADSSIFQDHVSSDRCYFLHSPDARWAYAMREHIRALRWRNKPFRVGYYEYRTNDEHVGTMYPDAESLFASLKSDLLAHPSSILYNTSTYELSGLTCHARMNISVQRRYGRAYYSAWLHFPTVFDTINPRPSYARYWGVTPVGANVFFDIDEQTTDYFFDFFGKGYAPGNKLNAQVDENGVFWSVDSPPVLNGEMLVQATADVMSSGQYKTIGIEFNPYAMFDLQPCFKYK